MTLTQQHMEHLVLLHLELEQVKLNMFSQLKRYGKQNPKLKIDINGTLPTGVYAKDIILHLIKTYGVDFGTGYA